jgi:5-methylcytosine-specific restriction endonuclease McrA
MNTLNSNRTRPVVKADLIRYSKVCDLCFVNLGTDVHEIIPRSRTPKGSIQRGMTYQKELVSLLCRECHTKAHNRDTQAILLKRNYYKYGEQAVKRALLEVEELMGTDTNILEEK